MKQLASERGGALDRALLSGECAQSFYGNEGVFANDRNCNPWFSGF